MRNFKTLLIAAAFAVLGTSVFAADATVTYVSGKVEVQRGGKWVALQKGDVVAKSETISTGFQSEAKIKLLDSVMYLGPVTRITLEELSSVDQTDNVNVYLKTGTARSQVKHVDNKRVNYQVHTAVAVASCRGTDWIAYDSNLFDGIDGMFAVRAIKILQEGGGAVTLSSDDGVLVQGNQTCSVSEGDAVSAAVSAVVNNANTVAGSVATAASREAEGGAGVGGGAVNSIEALVNGSGNGSGRTETATIIVILELPVE